MIINKMFKFFLSSLILYVFITNNVLADSGFYKWSKQFQIKAVNSGISEKVVKDVMANAKFLPKVIEYDRFQPEFYEDTLTYIKKRSSIRKIKAGVKLYNQERIIIEKVEKDFQVEKELLLALMGIETNFGKYLGKMDIVSSLATLSYDKRRSAFFTEELLILLKLVDNNIIDKDILYGSWAGAFGNFQFMPSTIKNYAIDYNSNSQIELKQIDDSFASAANYLKKMGWKKNKPCFYKISLNNYVPEELLNTSAKKITNKKKLSYFKKYINNFDELNLNNNTYAAIITPDKDIIPGTETLKPAYLVFENYELILKWNRSLRFALAVCTLKNEFKNEL